MKTDDFDYFLPEELIENLEGSLGLVWDGNTIETCDGPFGNYLRYLIKQKIRTIPVNKTNKTMCSHFYECVFSE